MINHYTEAPEWAVLHMEPDADARNIKRAYARRLKVVRPDDDAAAFQELRAAYEWALELAAYLASQPQAPQQDQPQDQQQQGTEQNAAQSEAPSQQLAPLPADVPEQPQAAADGALQPVQPQIADPLAAPAPAKTIVLQPSLDFPYQPEQPIFLTPREAWQLAGQMWQDFVKDSLERHEPVQVEKDTLGAVTQALKDILRSDDMEPLIARTELHHFAIHYCADENAAPLIRLACLAAFNWEGERDYLHSYAAAPAWLAINRAIADQQYQEMFVASVLTESDKLLIEPGPPRIRWHKFYFSKFRQELGETLNEIRTKKRELEIYRIGTPKLEIWAEAVFRPWPQLNYYMWALGIGYFLASLGTKLLQESGLPASLGWGLFMLAWSLPAVLLLVYPRFLYPLRNRVDIGVVQGEKSRYGVWLAHVALSLLAFALVYLPPVLSDGFIAAAFGLALANLIVRYGFNVQILVTVLMFALWSGMGVVGALMPFLQERAFFAVALAPGLLMAAPVPLFRFYGKPLQDRQNRLILLASGLALVGVQVLAGLYLPLPAAIAGWCWVLLAAQACDLSFTFITRLQGRAGAFLWMICTFGIFYLPWAVLPKGYVEWTVAGMLRLQASLALGLLIGLAQDLIAQRKAAKNA
ncbi:hypothetical protein ACO0LO_18830 [Undibacterium sp. TJN25]|uniref:hypothetical protein n=1 Tax=Undibacterium sp. TJN25 TaxID=3413056 RepID=UPI003BF3D6FF